MSSFTTPLIVKLVGNNLWSVFEPFDYHVGSYPSKEIIHVPVGFVTDFASVPRIFWSVISPIDKHGKAAVIHDYLYYSRKYSKHKCDLIFREALKVLDVTPWKVFCMYWAVNLFGWLAWYKNRLRKGRKNR
jgi:hypothetical protein